MKFPNSRATASSGLTEHSTQELDTALEAGGDDVGEDLATGDGDAARASPECVCRRRAHP